MRPLKNRGNLYYVNRILFREGFADFVVVGIFPTHEGADAYKGACEQQFFEKGFTEDEFEFSVGLSTYYDA